MKRFKKTTFILIALILAILLTFCQCGNKEEANEIDTSEIIEETEDAFSLVNLFSYESSFDESKPIYVIGHLVPDSDTVCSAIAFSNLLEQLGYKAVPVISDRLNAESKFILEKFEVNTPEILDDAQGKQFVLVDHSAYSQSIINMENADILGIIDHHNIGSIKTDEPILYLSMPLGSTATIVYQLYGYYNIPLTQEISGLLLSAILSDTTGLKSAITTEYDIEAVKALGTIANVDDYEAYTYEILMAGNTYDSMTIEEILYSDIKLYEVSDKEFAIAFVQSSDENQLKRIEEQLNLYMENNFDSIGASPVYVMMVNQKTAITKLLCYGDDALNIAKEAFDISDDEIILENTLSRKKQVLPPLIKVIE